MQNRIARDINETTRHRKIVGWSDGRKRCGIDTGCKQVGRDVTRLPVQMFSRNAGKGRAARRGAPALEIILCGEADHPHDLLHPGEAARTLRADQAPKSSIYSARGFERSATSS